MTFKLDSTYIHLADGPSALPIAVGDDFWARIGERADLDEGRLVMSFAMSGDWDHWEMHPNGDEVVYVVSGDVDFILDETDGERAVHLGDREGIVVPAGVWHRAEVHAPSEVLTITRGAGTEHRPR